MARSSGLGVPVVTGLSLTTRIRYPVPEGVPAGMVALIGEAPDPIFTGLAKLPVASESCAVKVPLNEPVNVYGTLTLAPVVGVMQNGDPVMVPVAIEGLVDTPRTVKSSIL
ncbi:hypothetical protein JCM30197_14150 [Schleiferia thermophila]|nr:hypothetical protein JCM30197_14150 [Schleiferia thermophila]